MNPPMSFFFVGFAIVFVIIVGLIVYAVVQAATEAVNNSRSPILSTPARIVTKRSETSGGGNDTSVSTSYFVSFEMESGERREWRVASQEYGLLVEGDRGTLTYQGTWFKDFVRQSTHS